jgi:di/tricarboxylate transporter
MPPPPDPHGIAMMLVAAVALFLFSRDRIPMETSALVIFAVLVVGFEVFPYEVNGRTLDPASFLADFANDALITIMALLICTRGLEATGALQPVADRLAVLWARSPKLALLVALLLCGVLSMFLNNTPVVAMMLPILVSVCIRTGTPTSGVLMPIGYATIIGGLCTTIGTSTNLLVVQMAVEHGMPRMGIFHFTPIAVIGAVLGILYLWLFAPRLVPARTSPMPDTSPRVFEAILHVNEGSQIAGKSVRELLARTEGQMRLEGIERGDGLFVARFPSVIVRAGDRLHVRDTPDRLKRFETQLGATLFDAYDPSHAVTADERLQAGDQRLAEIVVTRGSPLHRRTLKNVPFFAHHGLLPVAVHRPRAPTAESADIGEIFLRAGDIVLVQGRGASLDQVKRLGNVLVVDGSLDLPHTSKAWVTSTIMAGVIVAAASGIVSITVSALCGVLAMIVTGSLTWKAALGAMDRRLIIVIVTSLALGRSLTATGGTQFLADLFVTVAQPMPLAVSLGALLLLAALVTEIVTNNATAVLATPVAIFIAQKLGTDPEPFVLAVLFGANMSYLTPIGYQTNLMVMSAGGYRFADFFRVGVPLQIIMWLSLSIVLVVAYQLY